MISTLNHIMLLIDDYELYLTVQGVRFDKNGFPIPEQSWYLDERPELIVTYRERKSRLVRHPDKTVLCFFCADARIYPRLKNVLKELDAYRCFMGVIGPDVTVTPDMDVEWQREIILLNQLFMAVLAVNGIKVIQNLRIGGPETLSCLVNVPDGIMCASGTLGCVLTKPDDYSYSVKLCMLHPSEVLLYGRRDKLLERQLDVLGIPHHRYDDTHTLHKSANMSRLPNQS